jgi:alkylated DNA nucleotide flippase Atl1
VVSFGVVAKELMKRTKRTITAQLVGRQLSGMPESEWYQLPWWRVVNKAGYVSALKL